MRSFEVMRACRCGSIKEPNITNSTPKIASHEGIESVLPRQGEFLPVFPCVSSSRPFGQLPLKIINVEKPNNTRLATRDA